MPNWLIAVMVTVVLAVLGGIYNLALTVGQINDKLDRNCRILTQLDQDIRFHEATQKALWTRTDAAGLPPFPEVSC